MAECIRDLLQRWFYDRRTNALEMSTYLTTFTNENVKDRTEIAQRCETHPIHFNKFKVDDKWKETTIVLDERSCSGREWDLDDLPCSHAMAVVRHASQYFNSVHLSVVVDFANLNFCFLVCHDLGSRECQSTHLFSTFTQHDFLNILMK
ncbi:hypothetical protein Ddye_021005 [Dipteronia dyeriana]|uniref:SWIM-type domain-containing protein n=1 Tax=Dipteronia dyeriana TaxID=168575 RepID=A0AAD9WXK3_9ROSI|nr:hypothetical protein Ddye_021005 [Dipteronia dyeriana]